ncbi:MAG: AAA family ATPase, partial [Sulfurovaceae bacterium]|nr:AAA family ATPase [Sulfurovaceae bacterium]
EIKNFKCFDDFKAEGFGRVNLIGGKNNVGKTAFMEAVYMNSSKETSFYAIRNIIVARYFSDIFLDLFSEVGNKFIENFIKEKSKIYMNNQIKSSLDDLTVNTVFKSTYKAPKNQYEKLYSSIIENELEDRLDSSLQEFDNSIEKFRIINSQPHCKKNGKFYDLNEFGDGLGKFVYFILLLLSQKSSIILIDEIENGIHYTNLDKLWEIILTISEQQNVQVFATTHSKECIESYARVSKKLEDEEITFIELCHREEEIKAFVYLYDWFIDEIEQDHEVRGCL